MKKILRFIFISIICLLIVAWVIDRSQLKNRPAQDDLARARYMVYVVSKSCADFFRQPDADPLTQKRTRAKCDLLAHVAAITSVEPVPMWIAVK